ncbi:hypothetical protein LJ707_10110 [Mucilaginibacter sp. UR6-1]|uniref:hypothetical protein n=1 Tax=Mucilaginibacter sp. UR6-1 TaxID=1435643 RepID=UPI001E38534A|nr:hypothetical protein [Mucilaginibacter sp. UR6-1]MCC8409287.1 hypothetical protein [Mucilaginibacter sp. UR6-1]
MTDLNEYECEMLDVMLEAFGVPDSLTRRQILELFDHDEAAAFAMVQALIREDLVVASGSYGEFELPEKLILKPKGEKFLKDGGFTRRYQQEQQRTNEVGGTLAKLQQQNMKLQNERLANQSQVIDLQKKAAAMRMQLYISWALIVIALLIGYFIGRK